MTNSKPITPNRSVQLLHPKAKAQFIALEKEFIGLYQAGLSEFRFEIFEGVRDAYRQDQLFRDGVSKARAWQSAHQYGLACDFVPRKRGEVWTWDLKDLGASEMARFRRIVAANGLTAPIEWDPFHVQHPLWDKLRLLVL